MASGFLMEEGARRSELGPGGAGVGADLISALPEDLLLQVLVCLRCACAAVRTGLLCRRWRGLWVHLPDLVFRDVPLVSLVPALSSLQAAVGPGPGVSLLDIRVPGHGLEGACVLSLLHAAAGLSPIDFSLDLPREVIEELNVPKLRLTPPWTSALERVSLSLSGCRLDLPALVLSCPCLRVLWVSGASLDAAGINIRSESLQELYVRANYNSTKCVNVETPFLKKLTLLFVTFADLTVSVVAPILEEVSWECSYSMKTAVLGPWGLSDVSLRAGESLGQRVITGPWEDAPLQQLSNVYVLSLQMSSRGWLSAVHNIAQQIEKHLVTDFSVLELIMEYDYGTRHVFGPFVLRLLGTHRILVATRRLRIQLLRSKVKEECMVNCPCDEPKNWRSKYGPVLLAASPRSCPPPSFLEKPPQKFRQASKLV